MRKKLISIVVVAALAFGICYFGSPYLAARNLMQAVNGGDADKIGAGMDLASVKDSLKAQLSAAYMRKMGSDPGTRGNPFAALGALIAPVIIDRAVDTYVTPEGIATVMKGGKPGEAQPDQSAQASAYGSDEEYLGRDRFRVTIHARTSGKQGPALLFERRGLFTWKLVEIELPPDVF